MMPRWRSIRDFCAIVAGRLARRRAEAATASNRAVGALTREIVAAGCAAVAVLLMTVDAVAVFRIRHNPCPVDTTEIETAMESAAELAALNKRVDDAFQSLQRLPQAPDQRFFRNVIRANWLCEVARQCGQYAAGDARSSQCLQDALRLRALDLEGQLKTRLENH